MTKLEMFLEILILSLAFNCAFGINALKGNETQINFDTIDVTTLKCDIDENLQFFTTHNISYGYGLFADCNVFLFDTRHNSAWHVIKSKLDAPFTEKDICYGNDFIVDLEIDLAGKPHIFVMDKTYLTFKHVAMPTDFEKNRFYISDSKMEEQEKGLPHGWTRRQHEYLYKEKHYGQVGSVTGKAISLIRRSGDGFRVNAGVRDNDRTLDYRCIIKQKNEHSYPPVLINYVPSTDWRTQILDDYYLEEGGSRPLEWYLDRISYLWIICVSLTIVAIAVAVVTGFIINRSRKAQVKLEVAVEALLASSCTNPEHQLRRSALLNKCGFPSVELNDTNITTAGGSLQDDTNGMQTINEYDVLAEQIRRVQAAPIPEKSEKSGTQSTQSSKKT